MASDVKGIQKHYLPLQRGEGSVRTEQVHNTWLWSTERAEEGRSVRGSARGRGPMSGCAGCSCAKEPPGEVCSYTLTSILPLEHGYVHMQEALVFSLTNALCRLVAVMVQDQWQTLMSFQSQWNRFQPHWINTEREWEEGNTQSVSALLWNETLSWEIKSGGEYQSIHEIQDEII